MFADCKDCGQSSTQFEHNLSHEAEQHLTKLTHLRARNKNYSPPARIILLKTPTASHRRPQLLPRRKPQREAQPVETRRPPLIRKEVKVTNRRAHHRPSRRHSSHRLRQLALSDDDDDDQIESA